MCKYFEMPECLKPLTAIKPQADGAITSRVISLKNVNKAYLVVHMNQTNAAQCTISLMQATDIAAATNKAISNNVTIYANQDLSVDDTLTKQSDAKTFQFSATLKEKCIVFCIDPAVAMDINGGYDCIYATSGGSNAGNIIAASWVTENKYCEATPPSIVVD